MINKRLLIKNLLAHNDESSFYDKKRQLNLHTREGKAKFLKHICALSNSNPGNNSYIVVGVEDQENTVVGTDFYDDSRIQNLVNAYLDNPPRIQYENIPFPNLPKDKVVGLVTIKGHSSTSSFKKSIHTLAIHSVFVRRGSNSIPVALPITKNFQNKVVVKDIENSSRNSIGYTLDNVIHFLNVKHKDMNPRYKVFKELFVICWAGNEKKFNNRMYVSRVDIELINEQIKLFYSDQDVVEISFDEDSFSIVEYVPLAVQNGINYYPLEAQTIHFFENGYYKIERKMLFQPPKFPTPFLNAIYKSNGNLLEQLAQQEQLSSQDLQELEKLPSNYMICYLNGFEDAKQKLIDAKLLLKPFPQVYLSFKESLRILRKMKYDIV